MFKAMLAELVKDEGHEATSSLLSGLDYYKYREEYNERKKKQKLDQTGSRSEQNNISTMENEPSPLRASKAENISSSPPHSTTPACKFTPARGAAYQLVKQLLSPVVKEREDAQISTTDNDDEEDEIIDFDALEEGEEIDDQEEMAAPDPDEQPVHAPVKYLQRRYLQCYLDVLKESFGGEGGENGGQHLGMMSEVIAAEKHEEYEESRKLARTPPIEDTYSSDNDEQTTTNYSSKHRTLLSPEQKIHVLQKQKQKELWLKITFGKSDHGIPSSRKGKRKKSKSSPDSFSPTAIEAYDFQRPSPQPRGKSKGKGGKHLPPLPQSTKPPQRSLSFFQQAALARVPSMRAAQLPSRHDLVTALNAAKVHFGKIPLRTSAQLIPLPCSNSYASDRTRQKSRVRFSIVKEVEASTAANNKKIAKDGPKIASPKNQTMLSSLDGWDNLTRTGLTASLLSRLAYCVSHCDDRMVNQLESLNGILGTQYVLRSVGFAVSQESEDPSQGGMLSWEAHPLTRYVIVSTEAEPFNLIVAIAANSTPQRSITEETEIDDPEEIYLENLFRKELETLEMSVVLEKQLLRLEHNKEEKQRLKLIFQEAVELHSIFGQRMKYLQVLEASGRQRLMHEYSECFRETEEHLGRHYHLVPCLSELNNFELLKDRFHTWGRCVRLRCPPRLLKSLDALQQWCLKTGRRRYFSQWVLFLQRNNKQESTHEVFVQRVLQARITGVSVSLHRSTVEKAKKVKEALLFSLKAIGIDVSVEKSDHRKSSSNLHESAFNFSNDEIFGQRVDDGAKIDSLTLVGHSTGGAIASCLAILLNNDAPHTNVRVNNIHAVAIPKICASTKGLTEDTNVFEYIGTTFFQFSDSEDPTVCLPKSYIPNAIGIFDPSMNELDLVLVSKLAPTLLGLGHELWCYHSVDRYIQHFMSLLLHSQDSGMSPHRKLGIIDGRKFQWPAAQYLREPRPLLGTFEILAANSSTTTRSCTAARSVLSPAMLNCLTEVFNNYAVHDMISFDTLLSICEHITPTPPMYLIAARLLAAMGTTASSPTAVGKTQNAPSGKGFKLSGFLGWIASEFLLSPSFVYQLFTLLNWEMEGAKLVRRRRPPAFRTKRQQQWFRPVQLFDSSSTPQQPQFSLAAKSALHHVFTHYSRVIPSSPFDARCAGISITSFECLCAMLKHMQWEGPISCIQFVEQSLSTIESLHIKDPSKALMNYSGDLTENGFLMIIQLMMAYYEENGVQMLMKYLWTLGYNDLFQHSITRGAMFHVHVKGSLQCDCLNRDERTTQQRRKEEVEYRRWVAQYIHDTQTQMLQKSNSANLKRAMSMQGSPLSPNYRGYRPKDEQDEEECSDNGEVAITLNEQSSFRLIPHSGAGKKLLLEMSTSKKKTTQLPPLEDTLTQLYGRDLVKLEQQHRCTPSPIKKTTFVEHKQIEQSRCASAPLTDWQEGGEVGEKEKPQRKLSVVKPLKKKKPVRAVEVMLPPALNTIGSVKGLYNAGAVHFVNNFQKHALLKGTSPQRQSHAALSELGFSSP